MQNVGLKVISDFISQMNNEELIELANNIAKTNKADKFSFYLGSAILDNDPLFIEVQEPVC
jgi:hypothetical protein